MIKIENVDVYGWETAIRGMRNPKNSWKYSDTKNFCNSSYLCDSREHAGKIGEKDLALMKKLVQAGTDHSKFMRMIVFTCDITAPMYWWKEMDTYKVGTVRNSCSTMHKITEKEFALNDFSTEHLFPAALEELKKTIEILNSYRTAYQKFDNISIVEKSLLTYGPLNKKDVWWQLIQLLPLSYNQKATWQANYGVLRNIYQARKNHKLDEWKTFCEFIESLPYSELITLDNTKRYCKDIKGEAQRNEEIPVLKKDCIYYQPDEISKETVYCSYNGHPLNSNGVVIDSCTSCERYLTLAQMTRVYKGE